MMDRRRGVVKRGTRSWRAGAGPSRRYEDRAPGSIIDRKSIAQVIAPAISGLRDKTMQTILVPYHEEAAARAALNVAIVLAKRFAGYVEGLLVRGEPTLSFVPGMIVPAEYLSGAVEEWRRFADRARREFVDATAAGGLSLQEPDAPGSGPAAGWRELPGDEAEIIGQHGRLFDLIVVGRPEGGRSPGWSEIREAALFETGRPVLLAPIEAPPPSGRTIIIAWNGSVETARTIAFAMPFLSAAERVEVLTVEGHTVPGPSGAEVATYLARHGIEAGSRVLKAGGRPPGEVILNEAGDVGADLVLKGAFTRSRFRQIIFGGTTQHILDYARVAVLLAH
jgi:nucleotide-binding universal stress UspA family protein